MVSPGGKQSSSLYSPPAGGGTHHLPVRRRFWILSSLPPSPPWSLSQCRWPSGQPTGTKFGLARLKASEDLDPGGFNKGPAMCSLPGCVTAIGESHNCRLLQRLSAIPILDPGNIHDISGAKAHLHHLHGRNLIGWGAGASYRRRPVGCIRLNWRIVGFFPLAGADLPLCDWSLPTWQRHHHHPRHRPLPSPRVRGRSLGVALPRPSGVSV